MNIPFENFDTEVKPRVSGIDVSYDLANINSSMILAADEVIDIVGEDVYNLTINHYESANYEAPGYEAEYGILDDLVHAVQDVMAYMAFYFHIPYLNIRVSNDGITRIESEREKTAYKYQEEQLKESLLVNAWNRMNKLVEYLNTNCTKYKLWKPAISIVAGDIYYVTETNGYQSNLYYEALVSHTSAATFIEDLAKWSELDREDDIVFWEWTESENYASYIQSIFQGYKTFGRYIGLERAPYFYIKSRYLIDEIVENDIKQRIEYAALIEAMQYNTLSVLQTELLERCRAYISRKTLAWAVERMDYYAIPSPYRMILSHEFKANESEFEAKSRLAGKYHALAQSYLERLDVYLQKQKDVAQSTYTENYKVQNPQTKTDKYFFV